MGSSQVSRLCSEAGVRGMASLRETWAVMAESPAWAVMESLSEVGHFAGAAFKVAPPTGSGYIAVRPGELVMIRHLGTGGAERGWLYVRRHEPPNDEGWLHMTAVVHGTAMFAALIRLLEASEGG